MLLGDLIEKLTSSDRIVIINAARQVIYRGFVANVECAGIRKTRRVKKIGIGLETYRVTEKLWDWQKTDALPPQVPVEQFGEYRIEELQHILYIRIELENEFEEAGWKT